MPAEDKIHPQVKNALIKDGWTITNEPYTIELEGEYLYADIGATRTIEQINIEMIVVEVKGFGQRSLMYALEEAFGQYQLYRKLLEVLQPEVKVYLAIPQSAYERLEKRAPFRFLMQRKEMSLIIVDTNKEEVVEWIE